jgi:hypothetical protein
MFINTSKHYTNTCTNVHTMIDTITPKILTFPPQWPSILVPTQKDSEEPAAFNFHPQDGGLPLRKNKTKSYMQNILIVV